MSETPSAEGHPRILLAEDDLDLSEITCEILELSGYSVSSVTNGEECVQRWENGHYDLLLLDYNLPGKNGLGILEKVRRQKDPVPVVMFTGDTSQTLAIQVFRSGADDFIQKPFDPDYLVLVVKRAIARGNLEHVLSSERASRLALEEVNQRLTEWMAELSHALRTPMHGMANFIQLAQLSLKRHDQDKTSAFLEQAGKAQDRLKAFLGHMELLTQLELGYYTVHIQKTDLAQSIRLLLGDFSDLAQRHGLSLQSRIEETGPVLFDPNTLADWLFALGDYLFVRSALDQPVRLEVHAGQSEVEIRLTDHGPPWLKALPTTPIAPFFDPRGVPGGDVPSLGLAIAQRIIIKTSGRLTTGSDTLGTFLVVNFPLIMKEDPS